LGRLFDSMDVCQSIFASFFTRAACGAFDLDEPADLMRLLAGMARHKLLHQAERQGALRRDYRRTAAGSAQVVEQGVASADPSPSRLLAGRELLEAFRGRLS